MFDELEKSKSIERTAAWFEAELTKLDLTWENVKALFEQAWQAIDAVDLLSPSKAWSKAKVVFEPTIRRLWDFATAVAARVFEWLKEIALEKVGAWAKSKKGYPLLTMMLGRDPITGEVVERTPGGLRVRGARRRAGRRAAQEAAAGVAGHRAHSRLAHGRGREARPHVREDPRAVRPSVGRASRSATCSRRRCCSTSWRRSSARTVERLLGFVVAVGKKVLEFIFEGVMAIAGPFGRQIVGDRHQGRATRSTRSSPTRSGSSVTSSTPSSAASSSSPTTSGSTSRRA